MFSNVSPLDRPILPKASAVHDKLVRTLLDDRNVCSKLSEKDPNLVLRLNDIRLWADIRGLNGANLKMPSGMAAPWLLHANPAHPLVVYPCIEFFQHHAVC